MDEQARLRREYADRQRRFAGSDAYSWFNSTNLFLVQQRQRAILSALKAAGLRSLSGLRILEIGCGDGGVLHEFSSFGAAPDSLFGLDILPDRLTAARRRLPGAHFFLANGGRLPAPAASFDLVVQFTALSSVLDDDLRRAVTSEMLRVLRPSGCILWYDFLWNPTNRQTRGIRSRELHALFPGCKVSLRRITLAPPIANRLVPLSWTLAALLEKTVVFNSHYLAVIRPV